MYFCFFLPAMWFGDFVLFHALSIEQCIREYIHQNVIRARAPLGDAGLPVIPLILISSTPPSYLKYCRPAYKTFPERCWAHSHSCSGHTPSQESRCVTFWWSMLVGAWRCCVMLSGGIRFTYSFLWWLLLCCCSVRIALKLP